MSKDTVVTASQLLDAGITPEVHKKIVANHKQRVHGRLDFEDFGGCKICGSYAAESIAISWETESRSKKEGQDSRVK